MIELKIDPEFENLIPKLTDAEYAQLEKNILADGKVKEPIVVWNGTIIDGHHRYYIVKKHPEISFEIEEKNFVDKYEAMAWACANQLGRRNLTEKDSEYLRGQEYRNKELSDAFHGNQYVDKSGRGQIGPHQKIGHVTAEKMAEKYGVAEHTIRRNADFSEGVDIAEQVVPGLKEEILHGNLDVPKSVVQKLPKVTPDKQRKASIAISQKEIEKAKEILGEDSKANKQKSLKEYGLQDDGKEIKFTIDDLYSDIETNFEKCMDGLENTVSLHKDILDDENKQNLIDKLKKLFDQKVRKFMEDI